jgi:hypothetical protein
MRKMKPISSTQMGSILGTLFGYSESDDLPNGTQLLTAYFNEATNYPANFTYDNAADFMTAMNATGGAGYDFVSLLGETLRNAEAAMSMSSSTAAIVALADSSQGTATGSQMINAVGGEGTNSINLAMAVPTVAAQTATQIATTAATAVEAVGTGALTALNWIQYWPYIAGGVALFAVYIFMKSEGKQVGAIHGAVKEIL